MTTKEYSFNNEIEKSLGARSEATEGVSGNTSPVPHWGCHEETWDELLK